MQNDPKTAIIIILLLAVIVLGYYTTVTSTKSKTTPEANSVVCNVPSDLKVTYNKPSQDELTKGAYWACNGLVCSKMLTPQEWVSKYCAQKDNQILCSVRTTQGDIDYPLTALNLSAIKECTEYTCLQEVMVRNASYTILPPK